MIGVLSMEQERARDRKDFSELLKELEPKQLDYVRHRLTTKTDKEAAELVGVTPSTVSRWKEAGAPIDEIVQLAKVDGILLARERLRRLTQEAIDTVVDTMKDGSKRAKRIKLDAALEILDRAGVEKRTNLGVELTQPSLILDE